ncbi:glycoside hydrolase [Gamsiella multidivaricata]|uniref:glycoside hydrolase n=1 Tax=Gamsiella multidivaricata TaxID=101098 RepID=UPI00221F2F26|nr:glycoside hydrolase [Gamsiella multidivaricata]KAI7830413.1 glycoside hydrolase [Gamsiella multidivaricata]
MVRAQRIVGYYGKTAGQCPDYPSFEPEDLPYNLYTHLNFAFASINDDGVIQTQHAEDLEGYKHFNDLKLKKPSLRTAITIGGWNMDMAYYSTMVSTQAKRQKFIKSAMIFVRQHGFDGIDFDWEYPSDDLRGGHPEDPKNFVLFMKEMRDAADAEVLTEGRERLILSIALPGGPFHGQYFHIPQLAQYADWLNIMAYNLHGQWEDMAFCAAPLYDTAKSTKYFGYSVDDAVKSMAPKSVDPKKFNLGLSFSGVTFTLKDKAKTAPGSPAIGPGKQGCQEKGAMSYFEVMRLSSLAQVADTKKPIDHFQRQVTQEPRRDEVGSCMYMVVNEDQWIGYDTPETFAAKIDYLKKAGFGGVSIWSMDSDMANHELTTSVYSSLTGPSDEIRKAGSSDSKDENSSEGKQTSAGIRDSSTFQIAGLAAKVMVVIMFSVVLLA